MTILVNGYCTLDELKAPGRLDIGDNDSIDDTHLESVITAVSRCIDADRNRRFYAVSETRYYTPETALFVPVDDLLSVTTLKTDENGDGTYERTWATTDYYLYPYNAVVNGRSYIAIERSLLSNYLFTRVRKSVEIAGSFGYSTTTPAAIKEACLLICARVWGRNKKPYGISGSADLGTLEVINAVSKDDEIQKLLNTIKRRVLP